MDLSIGVLEGRGWCAACDRHYDGSYVKIRVGALEIIRVCVSCARDLARRVVELVDEQVAEATT